MVHWEMGYGSIDSFVHLPTALNLTEVQLEASIPYPIWNVFYSYLLTCISCLARSKKAHHCYQPIVGLLAAWRFNTWTKFQLLLRTGTLPYGNTLYMYLVLFCQSANR